LPRSGLATGTVRLADMSAALAASRSQEQAVAHPACTGLARPSDPFVCWPLEPEVQPEYWLTDHERMRSGVVIVWLNTPFQMQFRVIDGLTVRFAESADRGGPRPVAQSVAREPARVRADVGRASPARRILVAIDLPGFGHSQRNDGPAFSSGDG